LKENEQRALNLTNNKEVMERQDKSFVTDIKHTTLLTVLSTLCVN